MALPKPRYVEDDAPEPQIETIAYQPGPQTQFAECEADICIFGGAAGGGKSVALLLEPLRNVGRTGDYAGVIFRRTTPSITHPGALWDTARKFYSRLGNCFALQTPTLRWEWDNGAKVQFSHLEHVDTVHDWHGAQIPYIGFDELTEFTEYQFFYMLSRNRSTCGVRPYVRATCNPDADSWVATFISWWIDDGTGLPIKERIGKLRYFIRVGDDLKWADSRDELQPEKLGIPRFRDDGKEAEYLVKSVTFIPATVYDNKELLKFDPGYIGNLLSLPQVERERLLGGNWKIKPSAGLHFKRTYVTMVNAEDVPKGLQWKRGYDFGGTAKTASNDPDFTTCTLIGRDVEGEDPYTYVGDHQYAQESTASVQERLKKNAKEDGIDVEICIPQDPGQAGKFQVSTVKTLLDGYNVKSSPEPQSKTPGTPAKVSRFGPFSSTAEHGFVKVVRAPWNERWFQQLEGFPAGSHDDDVDSTSRAFNAFHQGTTGMLVFLQQQAKGLAQKALEAARPYEAPTKATGVCFKGPVNVNVLFDQKGNALFRDEDGFFWVTPEHAKALRRPTSGFTEVK